MSQFVSGTIIKLSGSLLDLPDIADRLLTLIDEQKLSNVSVLVGGGEAAELVRTWDQRFGLPAEAAHRLAIDAMSLNAAMLVSLAERFVLVESLSEWQNWKAEPRNTLAVFHPTKILQELELQHAALPASWNVTSDSIAAWIADCCRIPSLLLLKSADVEAGVNGLDRPEILSRLAESGLVDPHFPTAAIDLPQISWYNLRADNSICDLVPKRP